VEHGIAALRLKQRQVLQIADLLPSEQEKAEDRIAFLCAGHFSQPPEAVI
jgi:hypothetical protein